jgi:hypothetical protein
MQCFGGMIILMIGLFFFIYLVPKWMTRRNQTIIPTNYHANNSKIHSQQYKNTTAPTRGNLEEQSFYSKRLYSVCYSLFWHGDRGKIAASF